MSTILRIDYYYQHTHLLGSDEQNIIESKVDDFVNYRVQ
jgi:hypothetical protein